MNTEQIEHGSPGQEKSAYSEAWNLEYLASILHHQRYISHKVISLLSKLSWQDWVVSAHVHASSQIKKAFEIQSHIVPVLLLLRQVTRGSRGQSKAYFLKVLLFDLEISVLLIPQVFISFHLFISTKNLHQITPV